MDCDPECAANEQAGIRRKPVGAEIAGAEQSTPGAGIVRTCRQGEAHGKQQDQI